MALLSSILGVKIQFGINLTKNKNRQRFSRGLTSGKPRGLVCLS